MLLKALLRRKLISLFTPAPFLVYPPSPCLPPHVLVYPPHFDDKMLSSVAYSHVIPNLHHLFSSVEHNKIFYKVSSNDMRVNNDNIFIFHQMLFSQSRYCVIILLYGILLRNLF